MFELLKEKNTSKTQNRVIIIDVFVGCLIILIMFFQLIGLIFEPDVIIDKFYFLALSMGRPIFPKYCDSNM